MNYLSVKNDIEFVKDKSDDWKWRIIAPFKAPEKGENYSKRLQAIIFQMNSGEIIEVPMEDILDALEIFGLEFKDKWKEAAIEIGRVRVINEEIIEWMEEIEAVARKVGVSQDVINAISHEAEVRRDILTSVREEAEEIAIELIEEEIYEYVFSEFQTKVYEYLAEKGALGMAAKETIIKRIKGVELGKAFLWAGAFPVKQPLKWLPWRKILTKAHFLPMKPARRCRMV